MKLPGPLSMPELSSHFEALSLQCRDESFREEINQEDVHWQIAEKHLEISLQALDNNFNTKINSEMGEDVEDEDGLGYSFQLKKNADENFSHDENELQITLSDPAAAREQINLVTSIFRFLRNACATSVNQKRCLRTKIAQLTSQLTQRACVWIDAEDDDMMSSVVLMCQVGLQFCVNLVSKNISSQAFIWDLYFPDGFQKLLVECHMHRKIVAFSGALLLNCINQENDPHLQQRREDLIMNRSLIIALLQGTLQKPVSTTSVLEDSDSHENDPAFEWLSILFRVLFQAGYYKALYNSIGAHLLSKLWSRVTPEQLIFLRMFHMYIQSNAKEAKEELIRDALPIFQFSKNAYLYILSSENDDRPEEVDEARKIMWVALENEAKILFLEVLGEVTVYSSAWTTASSSEICHVEETSLLLEQILQELHRVWKARAEDVNMRDRLTNAVHGTIPEQFPSEPFGYRSALIRIIGNMCYHHAIHQDLVREKGFLPLILNHCNLDDTNPLVREWSLVALRNLCEENEANQQYIQSLRPQGVESKVDLSNTGMKPVLDKETNKPKLVSMEDQTIKKQ